jgi:signal peptide peptidase SppA
MTRRYARAGIHAIDPKAFFAAFDDVYAPENETIDLTTVVAIRGPLSHHAGWCDSYDAILERVKLACAGPATTIVLRIDSPGGDVSGVYDTARAIRSACAAAGKRLVSYVDGQACSAAYALACAGEKIYASPTAALGSIGVIATRMDVTGANEKAGLHYSLVVSGARKTYGSPHTTMDDAEALEIQREVNWLAGQFFSLVSELRGLDAKKAAALEAGVFRGAEAQNIGLVDGLITFDSLLATVVSGDPATRVAGAKDMDKDEAARKALQALLDDEDGDEKSKARAQKALAAMDSDDEDEKKDEESASAEGDDEDEKKDEEAKAAASVPASAAASVAAHANDVSRRLALVEKQLEAANRASLFASRPDLDPKVFEGVPFDAVVKIVGRMAKPKAPKPAATATVAATRGAGQGDSSGAPALEPDAELDARMGFAAATAPIRKEGLRTYFGVLSREQAKAITDKSTGGAK